MRYNNMNYVKTYKDIQRYTETTQLDIPSFGVDVTQDIPDQYNIKGLFEFSG